MGNALSTTCCRLINVDPTADDANSAYLNSVTQRENLATWYRTNIAVTDVYEILRTIGHGRMGEVYHVRRKDGGRTHTEETKKKEEERGGEGGGLEPDLDSSMRSLRESLSLSNRSGRSRGRVGTSSASPEKNRSVRERSRSPFSSVKKRSITKKNKKTLAMLENNNNEDSSIGTGTGTGYEEQQGAVRKTPPNLRSAPKPKSILKNSGIGGGSTNGSGGGSSGSGEGDQSGCDIFCTVNGNDSPPSGVAGATGMTALITGKAFKYDNGEDDDDDDGSDDDSIPMNVNAISPIPSKILTPVQEQSQQLQHQQENTERKNGDDNNVEEAHPTFSISDDASVVSDVTNGDEMSSRNNNIDHVSIVAGDNLKQTGAKKDKWVPRRRVFFRRHYACKTIATENINREDMEELLNEIYMMRKMDHPYIIRLYEVYQVQQKIWLVMDLCNGGALNSRKLDEHQVTVVAEQILRGVAYLHKRGICHRDLKMENILYENKNPDSPIRLIDFGLSLTYDHQMDTKQKFKGAAYTLSPEVLAKKKYTEKSDMWSIGVIIWIMLAGDYPFIKQYDDLKVEATKKKLLQANYNFGITWRGRGITEFAKSFVKGCLHCNPEDRWSALEALEYMQDTWIPKLEEKNKQYIEANEKNFRKPQRLKAQDSMKLTKEKMPPPTTISATMRKQGLDLMDHDAVEGIKRYSEYSLFRKTILVTMAHTMDSKDVGGLQKLFLMIDTNQSGTISLPEWKDVIHKYNYNDLEDENIEHIFAAIDYDQSGEVHYKEFVAAFSESQGLITHDRLTDTFDRIDSSGKGYIVHDDLKNILGENYSKDIVDKMIEEGDFKQNGQIDFDEFLQLMNA